MKYRRFLLLVMIAAVGSSACSVRRFAINKIGDALASSGSTYESDDDIELVAGALPFSIKLVEGMLAESPKHKGLLLVASQGLTSYAYIDVQQRLDKAAVTDFEAAEALKGRARRLYLRGHNHGLTALELAHPGFTVQLSKDPRAAVAVLKKKELPWIYWTAAGLGLAVSAARDDVSMLARLPEVEALIDRALELDAGWGDGALHEFSMIVTGARPGKLDVERIQKHFKQALDLSKGRNAGLYVAFAEALAVPQQNRAEFTRLLEQALSIDADSYKENRLLNSVAQRRARWLLERTDDLILAGESPAGGGRQ